MTTANSQKASHDYLIALGSNMRHPVHGGPRAIVAHALDHIASAKGHEVQAASRIISSRPIGPSQRNFANGAAIIASDLRPDRFLQFLKNIEREYGRERTSGRTGGQKWRARTLDLDIILWSGGAWQSRNPALTIPHQCYYSRDFVLRPALEIAHGWRDPVTGLQVAHYFYRLNSAKPLDPHAIRH